MQRMKGQGNPVPNGPKEQNYSSFQNYTNPMTSSMAASDPYMSSFYMTSTPYQAFGVGDGTWSNGGEHMQTFLGGYGGQVGYDSHSTIDGIFSGGNFGGFNAPAPSFNYGFHGNGDFNAWGGSDVRGGTKAYDDYYQRNVYQDDRVKTLDQSVQNLTLADPKNIQDLPKDANGCPVAANGASGEKVSSDSSSPNTADSTTMGSINQPKKGLSWASVASQPAKPQPSRRRDKSSMSSIVPGRHMDIGTWEGKNGGPKPVAPPPAPRPAWEAPRGGSRTNTSTYSTPPPRTPPQSTPPQQSVSPQIQTQQQQMVPSVAQPPQSQQQSQPPQQQPQQQPQQLQNQLQQQPQPPPSQPPQGSPQPQQLIVNQQHHSPTSPLLQTTNMREMSSSPQTGSSYSSSQAVPSQGLSAAPHPTLDDLQYRNEYNPKEFDMSPENARFFVIKSYSEDDIHRSIKYEIWCSTEHGNKRLDSAFRESEGKGPIFLFFSVNGSGHFCGIAQMISCVDYNCSSSVWAQDKWKGQFRVKWIYVKDVPNNPLRHIRLENNENKPVTNSRDTQEVPYEKGKMVLKIIHNYRHTTSIFDDFIHYEKRQEETEYRKGHQPYKEMERGEMKDPRDPRDPRSNPRGDFRGGEYREHREHPRDPHHRDYHRDYHPRGGPGGGGRGGRGGVGHHYHHHHHHHRGGARQ